MDSNTLIIIGINLLALGAVFGSLRQEVKDMGRRVTRLEDKVDGAFCKREASGEGPKE